MIGHFGRLGFVRNARVKKVKGRSIPVPKYEFGSTLHPDKV